MYEDERLAVVPSYLYQINPDEWNNIPIPLCETIKTFNQEFKNLYNSKKAQETTLQKENRTMVESIANLSKDMKDKIDEKHLEM